MVAKRKRGPASATGGTGDDATDRRAGSGDAEPVEPAPSLGEIIRRQRELSELSMREFARMAGISNPYLSQIERGLREPSERVVAAIAESLRMSADALYAQAGIDQDHEPEESAVVEAIRGDPALSARQRQTLIEIYDSFTGNRRSARRRRRSTG